MLTAKEAKRITAETRSIEQIKLDEKADKIIEKISKAIEETAKKGGNKVYLRDWIDELYHLNRVQYTLDRFSEAEYSINEYYVSW